MASGPLKGDGVSKTKRKLGGSANKIQKRSKPTIAARPEKSNSLVSEVNMMTISLDSISKLEIKNWKLKLKAELDELRSFMKQQEPLGNMNGANKKLKPENKFTAEILKGCKTLLTNLMRQKLGWVFSKPVDATKLGLYDYHSIVKKPMDLGTVKTKLNKSSYKSPLEFADDVRLTFNNAILYNPKGDEVHNMAEAYLKMFEDKWLPLETQYELLNRRQLPARDIDSHAPVNRNRDRNRNSPYVEPLPLPATTPSLSPPSPSVVENRTLERAESMTNPMEPSVLNVSPEKPQEEEEEEEDDDSRPRDLTFEEKQRLSVDLQDLPFDKLEAVVQIIKKRNPEIAQEDDEIELDIESLDLEILWELYRFVTEYKESLNKKKEKHGLQSERDAESFHNSVQNPNTLVTGPESLKGTESGHVASSVRQEVNADGSSSSNSSSSGSASCSSDSDSDSSGHGSDTGN